jgi:hypothetical protein
MKAVLRLLFVPVMTIIPGLLAPSSAPAGLINPDSFTSLGAFPTLAGTYTVNTSGTPTITAPDGSKIIGVDYTDSPGHVVAVFDFSSISLQSSQTLNASGNAIGSAPLVLLSQGDATIAGTIDASGSPYGAGAGGGGYGTSGAGQSGNLPSAGSGGGFGTAGQPNQPGTVSGYFGNFFGSGPIPAVPGGSTYGDLSVSLVGGSPGGNGGAPGGAVELGAVGNLSVLAGGQILANGNPTPVQLEGGGSGGGIFLHASNVYIDPASVIMADGGIGGSGATFYGGNLLEIGGAGGSGGGGRILIEYASQLTGSVSPLIAGAVVTIGPTSVPEPGAFLLATLAGAVIAAPALLGTRKSPSA